MRLLSATLRQVRQHRELQLRFDPRLTLIGGANEAGKSTLVEALHKGLFLKANATGRGVEELRSRLHAGHPEVEIGFEAKGKAWLLRKRFAGGSGTCQLEEAGGDALSGAVAEERLAALLGMAGPVEGRRIGQLTERWAHLWVRQGEAGSNLLGGTGDRYDIERLVEQLQQRSSGSALESPLDRLVAERVQQNLEQHFTATGRVKAGSPLALARQREEEARRVLAAARERVEQLEAAMEELRSAGERLEAIELRERPALMRLQRLQGERDLRQAEAEQLRQRVESLGQGRQQLEGLARQLEEQGVEHARRQEALATREGELSRLDSRLAELEGARQALERELQELTAQQELARTLLDLRQLEEDVGQLEEHRRRFQELQRQAETVKRTLSELAPLTMEGVAGLRAAEQKLAHAETRCQAMAASVELLSAGHPVKLDGVPLTPGEPRQLTEVADLWVGEGTLVRISPGGGQALEQARGEWERCRQTLEALRQSLGVAHSEEAEAIAAQRNQLGRELEGLRQVASTIPWAKLPERIAAMELRRRRLGDVLDSAGSLRRQLEKERGQPLPRDRAALEDWIDSLRSKGADVHRRSEGLERELQGHRLMRQELGAALQAERSQLEQLTGSLRALSQRHQVLVETHGSLEQLADQLAPLQEPLARLETQLRELQSQLNAGGAPDAGTGRAGIPLDRRQRDLEEEKDQLLTRRGRNLERCRSLGAGDPAAEVERRLAEWETAEAERQAIERQTDALQLLSQTFRQVRGDLALRYSEPLQQAIGGYLQNLAAFSPELGFDPDQGFRNLRLRQGAQIYGFEQLSGGMREQLSAALRLALADVLRGAYDNCLPLVFDDAFTAADPNRLEGVLRMLRRGADQGIQIILLSCTPGDYDTLMAGGGSRIELNGNPVMPAERK